MTKNEQLFELLDKLPGWYQQMTLSLHVDAMAVSTKIGYARDVIKFFEYMQSKNPYLAKKAIKDFTLHDIEQFTVQDANEYQASLSNLSSATLSRKLAAVSSMYVELMRIGKLNANPFSIVRRPKQKKTVIVYLTSEEEEKFFQVIQSGEGLTKRELGYHDAVRDEALFSLFLDTGLRLAEVCNITYSDIDLAHTAVIVTRKGGNHEEVFFSDVTAERIGDYLEEKNEVHTADDPIFTNSRGTALSPRSIEYLVEKYARIAFPMKHVSPHKLRSTFAMHFYAKTQDILLLKDKMGHSSVSTTQIYADAVKEKMRETRNILSDSLGHEAGILGNSLPM